MIRASLRVDLSNHTRVRKAIQSGQGPVKRVQAEWTRLYRAFILERFDRFSVGGGNWRRLSPAYQRRKRKNRDKILVLTRFMRMHLSRAIRVTEQDQKSVRFGFVDSTTHPEANLPVDELMNIHDQGLGVPQRRILVLPDERTLGQMRATQSSEMAREMRGER